MKIAVVFNMRLPAEDLRALLTEISALSVFGDVTAVPMVGPIKLSARGKRLPPDALVSLCDELGVTLDFGPFTVSADVLIWHDPAVLKSEVRLRARYVAHAFVVVPQTDIMTPDATPTYDFTAAMDLIERASLMNVRTMLPPEGGGKEDLERWAQKYHPDWTLIEALWRPAFEAEHLPPVRFPRDRRGRISPRDFSRFPDLDTMETLFPAHARRNVMLGADSFAAAEPPEHWVLLQQRDATPERMMGEIDFFLHYANPRAPLRLEQDMLAAVAAGKLVITDPDRAALFGPGVIGANPGAVDDIIQSMVADPAKYCDTIRSAQANLAQFAREAVVERWQKVLTKIEALP